MNFCEIILKWILNWINLGIVHPYLSFLGQCTWVSTCWPKQTLSRVAIQDVEHLGKKQSVLCSAIVTVERMESREGGESIGVLTRCSPDESINQSRLYLTVAETECYNSSVLFSAHWEPTMERVHHHVWGKEQWSLWWGIEKASWVCVNI